MFRLRVTARYLWIPVRLGGELKKISIYRETGEPVYAFTLPAHAAMQPPAVPDYYACLPVPED